MLNIKELLDEVKASPYREIKICAPHTGVVSFKEVASGDTVVGPSGKWKEKSGTILAQITRENNTKPLFATEKGIVEKVFTELEGQFVEAGEVLLVLKHYLTRNEVIELILQKALHLFHAPERAKYYFAPDIDQKLKVANKQSVKVHDGKELFIVSRMKRETPLVYSGPEGIIYSVYFQRGDNVDAGQPLIGICPEDQLEQIQDVVARVQSEWEEPV
ncbi:MAG: biotin/lipoyl-containing protein [Desulfovibrio sp.]